MSRILLYLLVWMSMGLICVSQNLPNNLIFERYSVENGLPGKILQNVFQGPQGFLWIGTHEAGFTRFDGLQFKNFRNNYSDSTSIPDDDLWAILPLNPSDTSFWVISMASGLSHFNPILERAIPWRVIEEKAGTKANRAVWNIFEDSKERIWIGTGGETGGMGLFLINPTNDSVWSYKHEPNSPYSISSNSPVQIIESDSNNFWITLWNDGKRPGGLNHFHLPSGKFTSFFPPQFDPIIHTYANLSAICKASSGKLWFAWMPYGIFIFDPDSKQFTHYMDRNELGITKGAFWVDFFFEDSNENIWMGTDSGLFVFDQETLKFQNFTFDPQDSYSLSNNRVKGAFEDQHNNIWIATGNGLNKIDRRINQFKFYSTQFILNSEYNAYVHILKNNKIWVKTWVSGSYELNPQNGNFRPIFEIVDNNGVKIRDPAVSMVDNKGNHWVPTPNGIGKYDAINNKVTFPFTNLPKAPFRIDFSAIYEDKSGNIWIGSRVALHKWSPISQTWEEYLYGSGNPRQIDVDIANQIEEDREGILWIGGRGSSSISSFDPKNEQSTLHKEISNQKISLEGARIWLYDSSKFLWIESRTHLIRAFPSGGKLENVKFWTWTELGDIQPSKQGRNLFEVEDGNFWIAAKNGIVQFDPLTDEVTKYSLPLKQESIFDTKRDEGTGLIYMSGTYGVYSFHPDSLRQNSIKPVVRITDFKIDNVSVPIRGSIADTLEQESPLIQAINYTSDIELAYWQNNFSFEFVALNYTNPKANQYQYKLENYSKDWIHTTADRPLATFTKIPHGTYEFKVRGSNNDGLWNDEWASIRIKINPPWWYSPWAYAGYTIFILGALYFLWRDQVKKQHEKLAREREKLGRQQQINEELRRIDALKDQFLANTSHELRTPLQGIVGLSEAMKDRSANSQDQEDLSMIIASGKRLNSLVNDILDFSKLKNSDIKLSQKTLSIQVLANIVLQNISPLVKGKSLTLFNEVSPNLPTVQGDENRLQQVLFNLVGNAIKFTETGHIKVFAQEKEKCIQVSVEDTGTGIPENKREVIFQEFEQADGSISREFSGTGLGLSISKKIIELHQGEMWVESEVGKGSTFSFTLPISKESISTQLTSSYDLQQWKPIPFVKRSEHNSSIPKNEKNSIHILIVDDEPINQQVFKNQLTNPNFHLKQAMNGEEALNMIDSDSKIDLVILDVMMPRMSGYQVCEIIRQKYLPSELPIILVTAKNQVKDIVTGLSLGANDYLAKPFNKEELLARINTQIDLHHIFEVAGRFVPNEFIRSLNVDRLTEVSLGDFIEKEVTVLFSDLRDYTTISETMTPQENFQFVNALHGRMGPIIKKNHGFVNQYLGDAVMAIFPTNPGDALKAAIEMQLKLLEYNEQRGKKHKRVLRMGIGLHTGPLIMGIIGDSDRMDAATIADTVNTTSRIENLTKHYGVSILLTEESINGMDKSNDYHTRFLGKVLVKGKKLPVGIFECFDGDLPDIAQKKKNTQIEFSKGLTQYFDREFHEALSTFSKVLKVNENDRPSQLFLSNSSKYALEGVSEDWTGIETMKFK